MYLSKKQILITGVYRSGTEYFSHLLNQHPEISSTMYRINALRFINNKYGINKINYNKLINDLSKRLEVKYKLNIDKKKYLKIINGKNYGEIYDTIMSNLYLNKKRNIWAEKNQLVWSKTDEFLNLFTNGYVIHILRDPRNVLASFKFKTNSKYPACLTSIFNSLDAMDNILKNKKKHRKRFIYLRYEDLTKNPQKSMDKIFKLLNVKKIKIKSNTKNFNYMGKKWVVNSSFQNKIKSITEFDINQSNNSFKKNLSSIELYLVEKICGSFMKKFKYRIKNNNIKVSKNELNKLINKNKLLKIGFENWKKKGVGFERFPKNPVNPKYWDKIQK